MLRCYAATVGAQPRVRRGRGGSERGRERQRTSGGGRDGSGRRVGRGKRRESRVRVEQTVREGCRPMTGRERIKGGRGEGVEGGVEGRRVGGLNEGREGMGMMGVSRAAAAGHSHSDTHHSRRQPLQQQHSAERRRKGGEGSDGGDSRSCISPMSDSRPNDRNECGRRESMRGRETERETPESSDGCEQCNDVRSETETRSKGCGRVRRSSVAARSVSPTV